MMANEQKQVEILCPLLLFLISVFKSLLSLYGRDLQLLKTLN